MKDRAGSVWGKAGGRLRWLKKTKAEKVAHMTMMSEKAALARLKKKKPSLKKPLDT